MTGFMIDLLLVAALGLCVWQGYRKGLILTAAGIIIVFLAAFVAGKVAAAYADPMSERLYPMLSWLADDAMDDAARGKGRINELTQPSEIADVAQQTFENLGISHIEIGKMVDKALLSLSETGRTVQEAISMSVLHGASYAILCLFAFILCMVGFTLLIHFLAALFKLPGLNLIDKIGGSAAGLLQGILLLCALGWAVRYLGIIAGPELVESTSVLKFFVNHNMLAGLLSYSPVLPI